MSALGLESKFVSDKSAIKVGVSQLANTLSGGAKEASFWIRVLPLFGCYFGVSVGQTAGGNRR